MTVQAELDRLVAETPDAEVTAVASFDRPVAIRDALASVGPRRLAVSGFRHGSLAHSGGYQVDAGEPLDAAVEQYRLDYETFTARLLARAERHAAATEDATVRSAMTAHAAELRQRLDTVRSMGLQISGLELRGKAADVSGYRRAVGFVRAVEVQHGARRNSAIPYDVR